MQDKPIIEQLTQFTKDELIEIIMQNVVAGTLDPDALFHPETVLIKQDRQKLDQLVAKYTEPLSLAILHASHDLTNDQSRTIQQTLDDLLDVINAVHDPSIAVATVLQAYHQLLVLLDQHPYTEQLTEPLEQLSDYLLTKGQACNEQLTTDECLSLFRLFLPLLKEPIFNHWGEYRMVLAEASVPYLAQTEPTILVEYFERLASLEADPFFSRGYREFAITLEIDYLETIDKDRAKQKMSANLGFATILERRLALAKAEHDYVKAEELIALRLHQLKNQPDYLKEEWYQELEALEQLAGDTLSSKDQLLKEALTGDLESYLALREKWQKSGVWAVKYPQLLYRMKKALYPHAYGVLLELEKEWEKLYSLVWQHRTFVFSFGDPLYPHYPKEISHFWKEQVFSLAAIADNQEDYLELGEELKDFANFGKVSLATMWINELVAQYPNKAELATELKKAQANFPKE